MRFSFLQKLQVLRLNMPSFRCRLAVLLVTTCILSANVFNFKNIFYNNKTLNTQHKKQPKTLQVEDVWHKTKDSQNLEPKQKIKSLKLLKWTRIYFLENMDNKFIECGDYRCYVTNNKRELPNSDIVAFNPDLGKGKSSFIDIYFSK